jgi:cytochrome P450
MSVTVDIYDPDLYVRGVPHDLFTELRNSTPVFWQPMPGLDGAESGYWAVMRHADVVEVSRNSDIYSATEGGVVLEDLAPAQLTMMRNMLLAMDPPRHTHYRQPVAPSFKARIIAGLEPRIRAIVSGILDRAQESGNVEFVHEVTSYLPSQIVGELMGIPEEDWPDINRWAEISTSGQDPEINPDAYRTGPSDGVSAMIGYAMAFAARRRQEPPLEDLTTLILGTEFEGRLMTDLDFGSFFNQLVTAGNDTTKTMLSSGLLSLLEHPDQLAALRPDLSLIPGAVEEILRHANPLHYFRRTAVADTTLRGVDIRAGEKIAMMYTSANRDEAVFERSQEFDIRRNPNPHLSFGIATHFCLGVHLARLEGRIFFEELLRRFGTIELTGDPVRTRSNLNNALKKLPVRLAA